MPHYKVVYRLHRLGSVQSARYIMLPSFCKRICVSTNVDVFILLNMLRL